MSEKSGSEAEEDDTQKEEDLPNIIVMMNESFSDLSVLGEFETNEDYMPFIHSLEQGEKNTVTGMLNVSVCGGNTANTEFEFLIRQYNWHSSRRGASRISSTSMEI